MDEFTVQQRHDISYPLWNMMSYFTENLKDLLFGVSINDYDPKFIMSRFDEVTSEKSYMISYNKMQYDSSDEAMKDSELFNTDPYTVLSEFNDLKT